jgi:hypothetical protein
MTTVNPVSFWLVKLLLAAMAIALLNGLGLGCASKPKAKQEPPKVVKKTHEHDFFPDEAEPTPVNHFNQAHIAAGAARDATLRTYHFTGNTINSLGREMLDLMIAQRAADQTLAVYIAGNEDDKAVEPRRERVTAYLTDAGLTKEQYELRVGANPDLLAPAAPIMARMIKTESGGAQGFKAEDTQKAAVVGGK